LFPLFPFSRSFRLLILFSSLSPSSLSLLTLLGIHARELFKIKSDKFRKTPAGRGGNYFRAGARGGGATTCNNATGRCLERGEGSPAYPCMLPPFLPPLLPPSPSSPFHTS
jgi:hypothetical protein